MKEIERQAFNMRCDDIGLSVESCALKAAVAFDYSEYYRAEVSRTKPRSAFDAVDEVHDNPAVNLHFKDSNSTSGNVDLECATCDQRLTVHSRYASGESAYTINVDFPVRCLAYTQERIRDIESVQSVKIVRDRAPGQPSS